MSGYTPCACRDCKEIAIGEPGKAYCHECEDAGCPDYQGVEGMSQECQREYDIGGEMATAMSREELVIYLEGRGFAVFDCESTEELREAARLDMEGERQ